MEKVVNKKPRGIVLAENIKNKELKYLFKLRDEMIDNNIDKTLIDKYVTEEYNKINNKYNNKIENYQKKSKNNDDKLLEKKKKKDINNLITNKKYMEERGINQDYIDKYTNMKYEEINEYYLKQKAENNIDTINNNDVEFID